MESKVELDLTQRAAQIAYKAYISILECFPSTEYEEKTMVAMRQRLAHHMNEWILVVSNGKTNMAVAYQGTAHLDYECDAIGKQGVVDQWFCEPFAPGLWLIVGKLDSYKEPDTCMGPGDWNTDFDGEERLATANDLAHLGIADDEWENHACEDESFDLDILRPIIEQQLKQSSPPPSSV